MSNAGVLDDYLEQLLGEAVAATAADDALAGASAMESGPVAAEPAGEREPTWDDLPDEVIYETGGDVGATLASEDDMALEAAFAAAAGKAAMPVPDPQVPAPVAGAAGGQREPTWDDLPDEVIYETGGDVSAALANADTPALEAAFAAAAGMPVMPMFESPRAAAASAAAVAFGAFGASIASPPARRPTERTSRWLRLRCGTQAYALELLKVQEVVLPVPLLPLRGTAPAVLGIMNLRGQVVPVMDLGIHLGGVPATDDAQTRIVVLEENGEIMGLRVSAVDDVTNLSDSQIEPPDTARICRISNDIFRGVARMQQQPMILLDATRLLG